MFHCVDCEKLSFSEKKSVQIIYRRIERKKNRTPKTAEMRKAMSYSKAKLFIFASVIFGAGCVIPLIWFSLIGLPFVAKAENDKWSKFFPKEKNEAAVLLANTK